MLNLSKIGKILKATNRMAEIKDFNNSIPIKIEVLKEINPITYKIKLGNKEVETKSYIPLEINKKYFANVKEKKGYIQITNLKEYPKLLEILEKMPNQKEIDITKDKIIQKLTSSTSKEEFLFFANIFLALQKGIYHLFINEKNNRGVMQYKYTKNQIIFYACYKFLGEIEGIITPKKIKIFTEYKNSAKLILENKEEINLDVEVALKNEIKPIYEFKNSLLNLKA